MSISEKRKIYRAYGYVRLSQDDIDDEESDSITNQKLLIKEFAAKKKDIRLIDFKTDDGCTGVTFNRKGFNELMELIHSGKCDCVIVKDLSRFGRNYVEAGRYIERVFPTLGVRFIAINDLYDSTENNTTVDSMMLPFKNLINDMYSKDISIKVRSHLDARRKKGIYTGPHVAYGYKRDKNDPGHLVIDSHPAEIVQTIFRKRLEGSSQQSIAEFLNLTGEPSPLEYKNMVGTKYNSGFKVRAKSLWSAKTVGRILTNEIYTGTTIQKKVSTISYKLRTPIYLPPEQQIRVEDTHDPIIEKRTFRLVQQLLDTNSFPSKEERTAYLFSGITVCERCGTRMEGQRVVYKDKRYIYYLCPCCQKSGKPNRVKESLLYDLVLHALQNHIANIVQIEKVVAKIGEIPFPKNEIQKISRQITLKKQEIEQYTKRRQALHEDFSRGFLSREEMQDYYQGYKDRCEEAEFAIQRLEQQMEDVMCSQSTDSTWIEQFLKYKNIKELTRRILISTVSTIKILDKKHIGLEFNFQQQFERVFDRVHSYLQCGDGVMREEA